MPTRQGSFRLFKLFGIEVFLHWSWFFILFYNIKIRSGAYSSIVWNVIECVSLFAIVLTHEFGHALACKSVGGQANQIVLWPFGGVAYVAPPQRPGAVLWSIVAGPLVNVVLVPVLSVIWWFAASAGWEDSIPDLYTYIKVIWIINLSLLIFNMLPIYPLDGGKILFALLWFILGRARSLMVATVLGLIGIAALAAWAVWGLVNQPQSGIWLLAICVFIGLNCFQGLQQARVMLRLSKAPRRDGFHCPHCNAAPPVGDFWTCANCRNKFDLFASQMTCPNCNAQYGGTICFDCGMGNRLSEWAHATPPAPPGPPASHNLS